MLQFIYRFYKRFKVKYELRTLYKRKEYNQARLRYWQSKILMPLQENEVLICMYQELIKIYEEKLFVNDIDIEAKENEYSNL